MKDFIIDKLNIFFLNKDFKGSTQKKTWYRTIQNVTLLCNLQKSRYGNCFLINFGIFFNDLNKDIETPKLTDCHLFGRIDRIISNIQIKESNTVSHYLSLELQEKETKIAVELLLEQIEKYILPYFEEVCDVNYLKQNFPNNFNHDALWLQNISEVEFVKYLKDK